MLKQNCPAVVYATHKIKQLADGRVEMMALVKSLLAHESAASLRANGLTQLACSAGDHRDQATQKLGGLIP